MNKRLSAEQLQYIQEHYTEECDAQLAKRFKCHESQVATARHRFRLCRPRGIKGGGRPWSHQEEEYLSENWGRVSVPTMAKKLERTENAVIVRARRLDLGAFLESGDYVTLNQLVIAVTGHKKSYSYKIKSWVENRGLPVHTKKNVACSWRVVYLEEFWDWAEKNRAFLDFSKMEPLALGEEPPWVAEQRKKDFAAFATQRKDPWTASEDSRLIMLLKLHRYGYAELSDLLQRSAGAIQRRCTDLGIKERPVRVAPGAKENAWSDADFQALADGIRRGDSYTVIGQAIGKSEKAVRGKVYFVYLTENADKIRAMMGSQPWGYGAPEPTVKQGLHLSRTRTEVRKNLSILDALLRKRMNDLGYDPYWQRFMCMNWDDIGGCSAGCADCDSCTEFRRIKPQYCARCGGTFYERAENRFCPPCRTARKKAAQRKFARLHAAAR